MTEEEKTAAIDKALAGLTRERIEEARDAERSVYKTTSDVTREMYQHLFKGECTLEQFGLMLVGVGLTAIAASSIKGEQPKLKLDLSALEKLKK